MRDRTPASLHRTAVALQGRAWVAAVPAEVVAEEVLVAAVFAPAGPPRGQLNAKAPVELPASFLHSR